MKLHFLIAFLCLFAANALAQDNLFSQQQHFKQEVSPALIGMKSSDLRFSVQNKKQWQSIGSAYERMNFDFEMNSNAFIPATNSGRVVPIETINNPTKSAGIFKSIANS